jgi:hypothetical protein
MVVPNIGKEFKKLAKNLVAGSEASAFEFNVGLAVFGLNRCDDRDYVASKS